MPANSRLAFSIFSPRAALWASTRSATSLSARAIISAARIAALAAAFTPTVATGMPGGIWMMLSMASRPSSMPLMGTPMTGTVVEAATTPGSAAAMPAAAIITLMPRPLACRANCSTASGVRWAERALTSKGMAMSSSCCMAFSITGRSLVLPMMMLTIGFIALWFCYTYTIARKAQTMPMR